MKNPAKLIGMFALAGVVSAGFAVSPGPVSGERPLHLVFSSSTQGYFDPCG